MSKILVDKSEEARIELENIKNKYDEMLNAIIKEQEHKLNVALQDLAKEAEEHAKQKQQNTDFRKRNEIDDFDSKIADLFSDDSETIDKKDVNE